MNEQQLKRAIRRVANAPAHAPIRIVPGDSRPTLRGSGFYYTTVGGRPVRHPNAYRRAWGRPVYHPSTLSVVVGRLYPQSVGWLPGPCPKL